MGSKVMGRKSCSEQALRSGKCGHLICALLFLAMLVEMPAYGQNAEGSINGQVIDPAGNVILNAAVKVVNVDTGVVNATKTNNAGLYQIGSLNPGTYTVTITAQGFETRVTDSVLVSAAASVELDGKLAVGHGTESVTVHADSALLSSNSDVSTTVDQQIVENLPYPERSSLEAVLLVPGVVGDTLNPGGISPENPNAYTNYFSPGASLIIGGTPAGTTAIIVDGSDVLEASFPRAGLNLSGYIVRETSVITAGL